MEKNTKLSAHNDFLEALDFNPKLVEEYFNKLIKGLEEELFSLNENKDKKITTQYADYQDKEEKYNDIKKEILKNYLQEIERLHKEYETDIINLKNQTHTKISEITQKIEMENALLEQVKIEHVNDFKNKTRASNLKIKEINEEIDKEYKEKLDTVFKAREILLKNDDHIKYNFDEHIKEIDEMIRFYKEMNNYSLTLTSDSFILEIDSNNTVIDSYLSFIEEKKAFWKDTSSFQDEFNALVNTFNNILTDAKADAEAKKAEIIEYKADIQSKFNRLEDSKKLINDKFDELKSDENSKAVEEDRDILISKIDNDKTKLAFISIIESDLLSKELKTIENYNNTLVSLNENISSKYNTLVTENDKEINYILNETESILKDAKSSLKVINFKYSESKNLLSYFEKRYRNLSFKTRLDSLENYKEYIIQSLDYSKKLDELSFELLTNSEILNMKLLDLKREYLTVDENSKIKEIQYDVDINEMKASLNINLNIKNFYNEIDLLNKDLLIDIDLKKKTLDKDLETAEIRKNLDLLRVDYMRAYSRLDNVKEIIKIDEEGKSLREEINTQIKIQKVIEISLLECISRKEQFESMLKAYDDSIKRLDENTRSRIRYQNDVLELERNRFETSKITINETIYELRQSVYPNLLNIKKDTNERIKRVNQVFKDAKKNDKKLNKTREDLMRDVIKSYNRAYKEFESSIQVLSGTENIKEFDKAIDTFLTKIETSIKNTYGLDHTFNQFNKLIIKGKTITDKDIKKALKLAQDVKKDVHIVLVDNLPEDDKDLEKFFKEYKDVNKEIVAIERINENSKLSPYLDSLEEIEKTKAEALAENEELLSSFKTIYIDTVRKIDSEYNRKLGELSRLKKEIIDHSETKNKDIDDLIESYQANLIKARDEKIKNETESSSINIKESDEKVDSLQKEIENYNKSFVDKTSAMEADLKEFENEKSVQAKKDYEDYLNNLKTNKVVLEKEISDKENNKGDFIKELMISSIETKTSYNEKREKAIETLENKKGDDLMTFEETYKKLQDITSSSYEAIKKPFEDFESSVSKITKTLIDESKKLTDEITSSSKEEYEKILNSLLEKSKVK